ncbi:DUF1295 domain-containing protein [Qipengyuania sp. DSG2-2]|uniref:DUF1295 domain-containing protein n=1 Tax=Qipengyuania sp. DGS2-2 TaxID=3349631 RepID=UPI0036D2B0EB
MANLKKSLRSFGVVIFATALGLGFAWLAGSTGQDLAGIPVLAVCAIMAFAVNWIAFVPAAIAQTEKFYDLIGSLTYITMIAVACLLSHDFGLGTKLDTRAIVVAIMVVVWAARLGTFLFIRISNDGGRDSRFDKIKVNPPRFLVAWTLQAVWTIITASAALAIITASDRVPLGVFFWLGAAIWVVGFGIEVVADKQKSAFKADPANKGKFINVGLWRWSQHPNYFGEIMLWTGVVVMALPVLSGWSFVVLSSPVFIYLLLTKISGINLQEQSSKSKWGDDPAYQEYRRKTPKLVPMPPRS